MNPTIGADTEEELTQMERETQRLHSCGMLDARSFNHRMAVVAGIRRVHASGRADLARYLLEAWRAHGVDAT